MALPTLGSGILNAIIMAGSLSTTYYLGDSLNLSDTTRWWASVAAGLVAVYSTNRPLNAVAVGSAIGLLSYTSALGQSRRLAVGGKRKRRKRRKQKR